MKDLFDGNFWGLLIKGLDFCYIRLYVCVCQVHHHQKKSNKTQITRNYDKEATLNSIFHGEYPT